MITWVDVLTAFLLLGGASFGGLALIAGLLLPRSVEAREEEAFLRGFRRRARFVASSGPASLAAVFLLATASGLANGVLSLPVPSVNDEFAYLLGADTFAHGRLANPQHPLWHHFETFSVSHDPTYTSKYPPATSAFMALGQWGLGHPWYGQLLAYALASTAFVWMLRAWLSPRWALVGGVLVALHPVMQHFARYDYNWSNYSWSHSYWGGSVAMLGASLLFGGMRRFVRRADGSAAFWMAIGIAFLAFSRPFEGGIVLIPVSWALTRSILRAKGTRLPAIGRLVLPMLAVGLPAFAFLLIYNDATTGDPWKLAHQHYRDQYGSAAELLIQRPKDLPAAYSNREMARFYQEWVRPAFEAQRSVWAHYWSFKREALERFVWFYLSFAAPALIGTFAVFRRRWWRMATGIVLVSVVLALVTFEFHPHYAATAAPMIHALLVAGLARLWSTSGRYTVLARTVVLLVVLAGTITRLFMLEWRNRDLDPEDWPRARAQIEAELAALPGEDLVLVLYRPDHSVFREWVKNGSELDGAPVVWARDLGDEASRARILEHYSDRIVWTLHPDEMPPVVQRVKRERDGQSADPRRARAAAATTGERAKAS